MRKALLAAASAAIFGGAAFFAGPQVHAQEEGIQWLSSYREAIAEAKRTGKPIFLEFRCEP